MNEPQKIRKKRAFTSEKARELRAKGHAVALYFAKLIGAEEVYKNDAKAKKGVVDLSGDSYSVKGGRKKWQIFLYSLSRFEEDFRTMNGIGELLINCINAFPESFDEYQKNKTKSKEKLRLHMVALADKLQDKHRLKDFVRKAMFNGGEVDYLAVFDNDKFHVF